MVGHLVRMATPINWPTNSNMANAVGDVAAGFGFGLPGGEPAIGDEQAVTGNYPSAYMSTDTGTFENYYGNNQRDYIATPRTIGLALKYNF